MTTRSLRPDPEAPDKVALALVAPGTMVATKKGKPPEVVAPGKAATAEAARKAAARLKLPDLARPPPHSFVRWRDAFAQHSSSTTTGYALD
jgi:hypothetical protein